MSRYGALTGKKKKVLSIKKESPRKFKKIIVGMKGSGKTGALIKEIEFALSEHVSPLPVYLQHYNNREFFKALLTGFYKNLEFKSLDFRRFNEIGQYKVAFFDDLILDDFVVNSLLNYIYDNNNLEGIIVTCDLIEFMNFMGQRSNLWEHLKNYKWIVEQLHG